MEVLSGMVVVAFGVSLTGLAVLIAIKPRLAERFLRSLASSARAHYAVLFDEEPEAASSTGSSCSAAHPQMMPLALR